MLSSRHLEMQDGYTKTEFALEIVTCNILRCPWSEHCYFLYTLKVLKDSPAYAFITFIPLLVILTFSWLIAPLTSIPWFQILPLFFFFLIRVVIFGLNFRHFEEITILFLYAIFFFFWSCSFLANHVFVYIIKKRSQACFSWCKHFGQVISQLLSLGNLPNPLFVSLGKVETLKVCNF